MQIFVVVVVLTPIFIYDHHCEHKQQQSITTTGSKTPEIPFSVTDLYKTRVNGLADVKRDDSVLLLSVPVAEQAGRVVVVVVEGGGLFLMPQCKPTAGFHAWLKN